MRSLSTSLLLVCFSLSSASSASWEVVPDNQVIETISTVPETSLSTKIRLLTWNIQKGEGSLGAQKWADDFHSISQGKSFVLIQESLQTDFMTSVLRALPELGWLMAKSFFLETDHKATGVSTASIQNAYSSVFLRSRDTEPISNTPKMSLLSTYTMDSGARILVVNVHAINFVLPSAFYRQMDDIAGIIRNWNEKVIWAGDFNTWASERTVYLSRLATSLGMTEVAFGNDPRNLVLDHIYVRGCSPYGSIVHSEIQSSDHYPLTTDLLCAD
jgi:endonuclease/exonuclease/phosphatase (EEP) superfamily protein YafD